MQVGDIVEIENHPFITFYRVNGELQRVENLFGFRGRISYITPEPMRQGTSEPQTSILVDFVSGEFQSRVTFFAWFSYLSLRVLTPLDLLAEV